VSATGHRDRPSGVGAVPVLSIAGASLSYGPRQLWSDLGLTVNPGEFLAVLGPNGAGKTSLLRAVLGQQPLTAGHMRLNGDPVRRGNRMIGYIPQQQLMQQGTPLRTRDMISLGLTGHRWGLGRQSPAQRELLESIIDRVGARSFADAPVAELSGGEQQRARVGQAIAASPSLLLCDEPLISLDLRHQQSVVNLIDRERRDSAAAVVFVTHDVNPILHVVDRILYLAGGSFTIGTPDEVLQSDVLSNLYGTPVDVIRSMGRVIIVGSHDTEATGHASHTSPKTAVKALAR
jgi:zinc/manganese transport system ATP-binding protein